MSSLSHLAALLLAALSPAQGSSAAACDRAIPSVDQHGALEDMAGASEAIPNGPDGAPYAADWIRHGRPNMGNRPGQFRSILPWSTIFAAPGNQMSRARVETRDMQLLVLSKRTGEWRELTASGPMSGGYYSKDIGKGLYLHPLDASDTGSGSAITIDDRYMTHFWPAGGRLSIDPDDVAGIYVSVEARIDPDDYAAGARYVMNAAADYWRDNGAKWDGIKNNRDAAIGRLKRLTPEWRTFYMTTTDAAGLERCVAPPGG